MHGTDSGPGSGLARSIEALFSSPPEARQREPQAKPADARREPPEPAAEATAAPGPAARAQAPAPAPPPPAAAEPAEPLARADDEAWTAAPDAVFDPFAVAEPVEEPVPAPPTEESAASLETHEPAAPEAATHEPSMLDAPSHPPAAPAADPAALEHAVDDLLEDLPGADDRLAELAASLQERLALDPLADAAERLVKAAGDPPHPRILDAARSVINPAVASRLVQRMGQARDEGVRDAYVDLCRRLGPIMANAVKGALTGAMDPERRKLCHRVLIEMGEVSRPVIEHMAQDENRLLVSSAVAVLGEIGGPRATELVTAALADTDPRVRQEAVHALAKLGDAESAPLVLGLLEDTEPSVRMAAAWAAGELRLQRAVRPLLGLLEEEEADPDHCLVLLEALGKIGDPGAVLAIEKHAVRTLFSKPRTDVRIAAYRALRDIGTPHARELLERAQSDKEPVIRAAVRDLVRDA